MVNSASNQDRRKTNLEVKSVRGHSNAFKLRRDVTLAVLSLEHASNMFQWMCDPTVSRNIGLRSEPSLNKTESWINCALLDPLIQPFAILFDHRHVGNVILDRIDNYLGTARLSVYLGDHSARGTGVGFTGIYLALFEGFEKLLLHKIWLTVHVNNLSAISTYRKLGFVLEGTLRDEFFLAGERVDLHYFGMLRGDFNRLSTTQIDE
jgi:RimJ/RimL family protein N-acetyltransferase